MMDMVVSAGDTRHAKIQSYRRHQQTDTPLSTERMPLLSPNHQCQSTEEKVFCLLM